MRYEGPSYRSCGCHRQRSSFLPRKRSFSTAAAVARRGVGLTHPIEEADAATTAQSLRSLLSESAFARAAAEVRDEIAVMPPPAELVPRLVALTRQRIS